MQSVKKDITRIATEYLDNGFKFEFWGEETNSPNHKGFLNDHSPVAGTDSDVAIAYYDKNGSLNLWLIEHKFTEPNFSNCNAAKSPGKKRPS